MRYTRPVVYVTLGFVCANAFLIFHSLHFNNDKLNRRLNFTNKIGDIFTLGAFCVTPSKNLNVHLSSKPYFKLMDSEEIPYRSTFLSGNQSGTGTPRIIKQETINYADFNITEPNFITKLGKELFYKGPSSKGIIIGSQQKERLTGEIYTVRKGTFTLPYDCGYRSNISFVTEPRDIPPNRWYRSIIPMMVPDGGTFQHFLDGTLPKIIQVLDYIKQPQVKLLMPPIRDHIIMEILEKLNISRDKILLYSGSAGADYLVFACIAPPLHPVLWQKARRLLGVTRKPTLLQNNAKIVLITRGGCFNCGRRLLNKDSLLSTLRDKYSSQSVHVFQGSLNLKETIELFGTATVIIGTHGGGLYNINFCSSNTTVIEIMPTYNNGSVVAASHRIFWLQSLLLEHQYWRIPAHPVNSKGDVNVDVTQIIDIIERSRNSTFQSFRLKV